MTVAVEMTLAKYAGKRAGNYCTLPKIDVEVLPVVRHCEECGVEVVYEMGQSYMGKWVHVTEVAEEHYVRPRLMCRYCNCEEPGVVEFKMMSWSDETHCQRCGGVDGRAIGD